MESEQSTKRKLAIVDLKTYTVDNAPLDVLAGIQNLGDAGKIECKFCGVKWTLKIQRLVQVEILEEGEDGG